MAEKKVKYSLAFCLLIVFSIISNAQLAAALTREAGLADFALKNQILTGAFTNTNNASDQFTNPFISYSNGYILEQCDEILNAETTKAASWFEGEIANAKVKENNDTADLYYSYMGYNAFSESELDATDVENAAEFIHEREDAATHGFADNPQQSASLSITYFAVMLLYEMGEQDHLEYGIDATEVSDFVISQWSNNYGGFTGEDYYNEISIIDTFCAVSTLQLINKLTVLTEAMKANIIELTDSYYVDNKGSETHYGGYSYSDNPYQSSLLLTYYCVAINQILGAQIPDSKATIDWILNQQSSTDYGFNDPNENSVNDGSSAILSQYAVKTLLLLDSDAFKEYLSDDKWLLNTRNWIIATIVGVSIFVVIVIIMVVKKYRHKL